MSLADHGLFITKGKLKITIVEAFSFINHDVKGIMDPRVKITYRPMNPKETEKGSADKDHIEYKTTVKVDGGTKPLWNETFEFDVKSI
jgi:hypothetical protein